MRLLNTISLPDPGAVSLSTSQYMSTYIALQLVLDRLVDLSAVAKFLALPNGNSLTGMLCTMLHWAALTY